ncbi:hypothetical protein ElyMa_004254900 [Elysia marginata]|uniref:Uncharacterized protein n=1 Tax=Elysia marginata TaxID=1093978 RepID=A0AAV4GSM0_9GAST|nr:hypothetical protein ElyMa_004254900 [Elysia marginata]
MITYDSDNDEEANNQIEKLLTDSGEESLSEVEGDEDDDLSKLESPLSDEEIKNLKVREFVFIECDGKKSQAWAYYTGRAVQAPVQNHARNYALLKPRDQPRREASNVDDVKNHN